DAGDSSSDREADVQRDVSFSVACGGEGNVCCRQAENACHEGGCCLGGRCIAKGASCNGSPFTQGVCNLCAQGECTVFLVLPAPDTGDAGRADSAREAR